MAEGPFALVRRVVRILDDLGIPYALGGSMASSLVGEPRSTIDADLAVKLEGSTAEALLERVDAEFYVPLSAARDAIRSNSSFNLLDTDNALKVDLFVLGDGRLDRMQIERRRLVAIPGTSDGIWVTSAEDQILRKLEWSRQSGGASDRQWRDVVGILRVRGTDLELEYLRSTASAIGLSDDLAEALREATQSNE